MKKLISAIIAFFIGIVLCFSQCDTTLWKHVYHPNRFVIKEKCKTVTGVIKRIRVEKDGDYHINLKLDKGQDSLLNNRNYEAQDSCLVIGIICVNQVLQSDAIKPCKKCPHKFSVIKIGEHVSVTGTYVLDKEKFVINGVLVQHGWMEIHPVSSIVEIK